MSWFSKLIGNITGQNNNHAADLATQAAQQTAAAANVQNQSLLTQQNAALMQVADAQKKAAEAAVAVQDNEGARQAEELRQKRMRAGQGLTATTLAAGGVLNTPSIATKMLMGQ